MGKKDREALVSLAEKRIKKQAESLSFEVWQTLDRLPGQLNNQYSGQLMEVSFHEVRSKFLESVSVSTNGER